MFIFSKFPNGVMAGPNNALTNDPVNLGLVFTAAPGQSYTGPVPGTYQKWTIVFINESRNIIWRYDTAAQRDQEWTDVKTSMSNVK